MERLEDSVDRNNSDNLHTEPMELENDFKEKSRVAVSSDIFDKKV
jgi:hypothetical protein